MPDPSGRYFFSDYKAELQARGFDGFTDADLGTYVNRGYFAVARKSRWYWERVSATFSIIPGQPNVELWPTVGGELLYFKSLREVICITNGQYRRLTVADEEDFLNNWLSQDLTQAKLQGEPTRYFEWDGRLYLLPVVQSARDYIAYYHRIVPPLVQPNDIPITPPDMDEVILDAARMRAHTRSNELSLAQLARTDLEEAYDDMRDQEEERMEDQPNRVLPDNTWL
jgi:hypothetical protein